MSRYIFALNVPEPASGKIRALMDRVAKITGLEAPYRTRPPYITLFPPVEAEEEDIQRIAKHLARNLPPMSFTTDEIHPFGKKYLSLQPKVPLALAEQWISACKIIREVPGYVRGRYEGENTLHITLARHTSSIFDKAYPRIKRLRVEPIEFIATLLVVYKEDQDGNWKCVGSFYMTGI